jgi:phosphomevalonate kinase
MLTLEREIPKITASTNISSDLSVVVTLDDSVVPSSQFADLIQGRVTHLSALVNLMASVKSWSNETDARSMALSLQMTIKHLEIGMSCCDDHEGEEHRKISFVIEQLKLLSKHKFARHNSPQLTVLAYLIFSTSAAAYRVLRDENVLCLPSVSTLKKVTKRLSVSTGLSNLAYLQ